MDYSKCVIYKIVCNDLSVTDCYVGHTTSFIDRKGHHKSQCNNEKGLKYNLKVYKTIRANGGWQNFSMIEIEKYPCKDNNEATARERFWYENLKGTMNSCVPNRSDKEYNEKYYVENQEKIKEKIYCICGGKYTITHKAKHFKTNKHLNFITSNNKDAETVTENKEIEPI